MTQSKKRLPRKEKKKAIASLGRQAYINFTKNPQIIYKQKIICDLTDKGFKTYHLGKMYFYVIHSKI